MQRFFTLAFLLLLLFCTAPNAAAQDQEQYQRIAEQLLRQTVLRFLGENEEYELDEELVRGTAKLVDLEEKLSTKVEDLVVGAGVADLKAVIKLPIAFEGEVMPPDGEEFIEVSGEADLTVVIKFTSQFEEHDGGATIRSRAEELSCEVGEIRDLEPEDIPEPKQLILRFFGAYKDKLQGTINDWLAEMASPS